MCAHGHVRCGGSYADWHLCQSSTGQGPREKSPVCATSDTDQQKWPHPRKPTARDLGLGLGLTRTGDEAMGTALGLGFARTGDEVMSIGLGPDLARTGDKTRGLGLGPGLASIGDETRGPGLGLQLALRALGMRRWTFLGLVLLQFCPCWGQDAGPWAWAWPCPHWKQEAGPWPWPWAWPCSH